MADLTIQIIIAAVMLVICLIAAIYGKLIRLTSSNKATEEAHNINKPVSIVITVRDEVAELQRTLPLWLSQEYPDYEVIVVIEKGNNDVEDVIKRLAGNKRLYTTYIPQSSRYMSRKKLSITLGIKAAKHNIILLTEPTTIPPNNEWLNKAAQYCVNHNFVLGLTQYENNAADLYRYEQIITTTRIINHTQRFRAIRTNMPLIMFNKDEFMNQHGFRQNQKYLRGEYDFITNQLGGKTAVCMNIDDKCDEIAPTAKQWKNTHLFYQETKKHLNYIKWYNIISATEQILYHASMFISLIVTIIAIMNQYLILTITLPIEIILLVIIRTKFINNILTKHHVKIPTWKVALLDLTTTWRNISWKIKYYKADHYDFISHKI